MAEAETIFFLETFEREYRHFILTAGISGITCRLISTLFDNEGEFL